MQLSRHTSRAKKRVQHRQPRFDALSLIRANRFVFTLPIFFNRFLIRVDAINRRDDTHVMAWKSEINEFRVHNWRS